MRRLKSLMKEQGLNASALAAEAGLGNTAVYDIISGKSKRPMHDVLARIAERLKVDIAYLIGVSNNRRIAQEPPRLAIPVIGIAETGAWRPMPDKNVRTTDLLALRKIDGVPHPSYRTAEHFALDAADDSMNVVGIVPGAQVLCIDLAGIEATIENGRLYAIRLTEKAHGVQTIIRRIVLDRDGNGFDLQPNSTNRKYRSIHCTGKPTTNPAKPVCVFGLVYRLERDLVDA